MVGGPLVAIKSIETVRFVYYWHYTLEAYDILLCVVYVYVYLNSMLYFRNIMW